MLTDDGPSAPSPLAGEGWGVGCGEPPGQHPLPLSLTLPREGGGDQRGTGSALPSPSPHKGHAPCDPDSRLPGAFLTILILAPGAGAVSVRPDEQATARRWAAAKFEGRADTEDLGPGYVVLANHDPVQRNARGGRPLNLAGKSFTRGLYCHAQSRVVVRLPGPAKTFHAIIGVDSNDQTSGGRGSVVFTVSAGGKTRFESPCSAKACRRVPPMLRLRAPRNWSSK